MPYVCFQCGHRVPNDHECRAPVPRWAVKKLELLKKTQRTAQWKAKLGTIPLWKIVLGALVFGSIIRWVL